MTTTRQVRTSRVRRMARATAEQLLVRPRRGSRTVSLQWRDGAGELHYHTLSQAQSWPFLGGE